LNVCGQCPAVTAALPFALSTIVAVQLASSPRSVKNNRPTVLLTSPPEVHPAPSGPSTGG
jgi:hypothetical protein